MKKSHALELPSSAQAWDRYYNRLTDQEKIALSEHKVTIGRGETKRSIALVINGEPNATYLRAVGRNEDGPRMGWTEFAQALWMLFDAESKGKLERAGVATTAEDDCGHVKTHGMAREDAADSPLAKCDPATISDAPEAEVMELLGITNRELARKVLDYYTDRIQAEVDRASFEKCRKLVTYFLSQPNIRLAAGAAMFVFRLDCVSGFASQSAFAAAIGLSKASVSKAVKALAKNLGVPESMWSCHMKSASACNALSEAQKAKHFRKQKIVAPAKRAA
jgi:hypothetical protein